jgi:WD40 repeat protein
MQCTGYPQSSHGVIYPRVAARRMGVCLILLLLSGVGRGDEPVVLGVRAVAFSPDGKRLAASTGEPEQKGTITVWELSTRKALWTHEEKTGIPAVAFAPDGQTIAIAVYDQTAKVLDVATGKEKTTLPHPKEVRAVAFSPDGKRLATACWDRVVRVWDLATGTEKVTCKGHKDRIFGVQFSPDGKLLASASGDDGAKLWDATTGEEKRSLNPARCFVRCALFTPDGQRVLTGGWDGTVRVWSVETGEMRARLGGFGGVDGIALSPDTPTMAVCGNGTSVDIRALDLREPTEKDRERIRTLLAKLDDDAIGAREEACKELVKVGLVAEPELQRAAKEAQSAEVRMRARRTRQEILNQRGTLLKGHTEGVECVSFSPDGKLLASGGKDGTVRLWGLPMGKEAGRLTPE